MSIQFFCPLREASLYRSLLKAGCRAALTPGPSPNNWERGDWIGGILGSPSPSLWESRVPAQRVAGGEGLPAES